MFKKINKNYIYKFSIDYPDWHVIEIEASCEDGKIFGLFGGQDLKVEIDDKKFREAPESKRPIHGLREDENYDRFDEGIKKAVAY